MSHDSSTPPPPTAPATSLALGNLFGGFEQSSLVSAHFRAADKYEKYAADRRKWADERGPIWQKYLAASLRLNRMARKHRERARELSSPNPATETRRE